MIQLTSRVPDAIEEMVIIRRFPKHNKPINQFAASEETEDPNKIVALIDAVLPAFRNQIPCRSLNTPKSIQNIEEIKNRKTEIMVGFCKVLVSADIRVIQYLLNL